MENFIRLIEEACSTICVLMGREPDEPTDEFWDALLQVLAVCVPPHRSRSRPSIAYFVLCFMFGHYRAHVLIQSFREWCIRRNVRY
jgi:hypothetical protein